MNKSQWSIKEESQHHHHNITTTNASICNLKYILSQFKDMSDSVGNQLPDEFVKVGGQKVERKDKIWIGTFFEELIKLFNS